MGRGERTRVITRGRKWLLTIGTILVLIYPVTASAAFLIRLKNGGEIITDRYWEEANRIMFYTASGGVFGIQKSLVKDIKASDSAPEETVVEQKEDNVPPQGMTTEQPNTASMPAPPPQEAQVPPKEISQTSGTENAQINAAYYRDKKRELQDKLDQASTSYREATTNEDLKAKEEARLDILEFTKQISGLAEELQQENGGVLPDWWGQL